MADETSLRGVEFDVDCLPACGPSKAVTSIHGFPGKRRFVCTAQLANRRSSVSSLVHADETSVSLRWSFTG